MRHAVNFPVIINLNKTISLFETGATILNMSKSHFDKLKPQPKLVRTNTYRVNGANGNSLGPIETTTCTLKFPKKFHPQFIVCENLL